MASFIFNWSCTIALLTCGALVAASDTGSLPRIAVQEGMFVDTTDDKPFVPLGANYYRVSKVDGDKPVHATFCPGFYDHAYIEQMMTNLKAWGFNTLRTFQVYHVGPSGILTSPQAREVSPAYLANVLHFLRQAQAHQIHVIFSWDIWEPPSQWWSSQPLPGEESYRFQPAWDEAMGVNNFRFTLTSVRNRANAIVALIEAIKQEDPSLLSVVLTWELENEVYWVVDRAPFNVRTGTFEFAGKTYDMSSDEKVQMLMDDGIIQWVNACADAIHQADPQALVSAGLFSFAAVGRGGPGTLSQDRTDDTRVPARLLALLRSRLDYVDLHNYAWMSATETLEANFRRNLESVEWDALQGEVKLLGKPILCGEFGVFANYLRNPPEWKIDHELGLQCLHEHVQRLHEAGYAGALYWPYGNPDSTDNDEIPALTLFPRYVETFNEAWRMSRQ